MKFFMVLEDSILIDNVNENLIQIEKFDLFTNEGNPFHFGWDGEIFFGDTKKNISPKILTNCGKLFAPVEINDWILEALQSLDARIGHTSFLVEERDDLRWGDRKWVYGVQGITVDEKSGLCLIVDGTEENKFFPDANRFGLKLRFINEEVSWRLSAAEEQREEERE